MYDDFLSAIGITLIVVCALVYIVTFWKIFTKANEKGYRVLIPFLNFYAFYRIVGGGNNVFALIASLLMISGQILLDGWLFIILYGLISIVTAYLLGGRFGCGAWFRVFLSIPFINAFAYIYLAFNEKCVYNKELKRLSSNGMFIFFTANIIWLLPIILYAIFIGGLNFGSSVISRFTATRTDAQVATARSDMASAQKAIVAKVFADNINVNKPKAPNPNKSPRNQTSADYREWGEWIMEVAGLDESRWKVFRFFGVVPIDSKINKPCYDSSKTPLLWINPCDGTMHFNPSKLNDNYGKKKGFCEALRDSYVSDSGNGDKVVEIGSNFSF